MISSVQTLRDVKFNMCSDTMASLQDQVAALTVEDKQYQLRQLITAAPHTDQVIRPGEFCREHEFVKGFSEEVTHLVQIYTEQKNRDCMVLLLGQECENALQEYFGTKEPLAALQRAINLGSLSAYHVDLNDANRIRGVTVSVFARTLIEKWKVSRSDHDLSASIFYCGKAVEIGPLNGLNRALHYADLGEQLGERYFKSHSPSDFDEASSCFKRACELGPSGQLIFIFRWARIVRCILEPRMGVLGFLSSE